MSAHKEGKVELTVWNIPPDVRKKFKLACMKKDVTMRETLINFMKRFARNAKS